jgi:hypothetical protein
LAHHGERRWQMTPGMREDNGLRLYESALSAAHGARSVAGLEGVLLTGMQLAWMTRDYADLAAGITVLRAYGPRRPQHAAPAIFYDPDNRIVTLLPKTDVFEAINAVLRLGVRANYAGIGTAVRAIGTDDHELSLEDLGTCRAWVVASAATAGFAIGAITGIAKGIATGAPLGPAGIIAGGILFGIVGGVAGAGLFSGLGNIAAPWVCAAGRATHLSQASSREQGCSARRRSASCPSGRQISLLHPTTAVVSFRCPSSQGLSMASPPAKAPSP